MTPLWRIFGWSLKWQIAITVANRRISASFDRWAEFFLKYFLIAEHIYSKKSLNSCNSVPCQFYDIYFWCFMGLSKSFESTAAYIWKPKIYLTTSISKCSLRQNRDLFCSSLLVSPLIKSSRKLPSFWLFFFSFLLQQSLANSRGSTFADSPLFHGLWMYSP